DLEEVPAAIGGIDRSGGIPGPGQRFDDDAVEAEAFFDGVTRVVVIDAHRRWRRRRAPRHNQREPEDSDSVAVHATSCKALAHCPSVFVLSWEVASKKGYGPFFGDLQV